MSRLIVCLAILALSFGILGASASFVGQWTDPLDADGYGISTYVCVIGNNMFGFYSQVGLIRGTITGDTATGRWYEPGSALYSRDETLASSGSFSITLAGDDNSWTGTFSYDDGETRPWVVTRIDALPPTESQCWSTSSDNDSLEGTWSLQNTLWFMCDSNGGSDRYYSTYSYQNEDGIVADTGFSQGIIENGIYRGEWTQSGVQAGVELIAAYGSNQLRSTWWQGDSFLLAPEFVNNPFSHLIDTYNPVDDDASDEQCFSYFSNAGTFSASLLSAFAVVMFVLA